MTNRPVGERLVVWLRFLMLPLKFIDHCLPKRGKIYDIGCSNGLVTYFLASCEGRKLVGVDSDCGRIEKAKTRLNKKNIVFICKKVENLTFFQTSGAVLSDFLHHIDYRTQEKLLKKIYSGFLKGGVVVIKEIDDADLIRKWLSRLWDFVLYPQDKIYYRSRLDWFRLLKTIGFSVKSYSTTYWFPGSTTVFVGKKNDKEK